MTRLARREWGKRLHPIRFRAWIPCKLGGQAFLWPSELTYFVGNSAPATKESLPILHIAGAFTEADASQRSATRCGTTVGAPVHGLGPFPTISDPFRTDNVQGYTPPGGHFLKGRRRS